MKRNFAEWLLTFTDSIADYKYYIDFETIYRNADRSGGRQKTMTCA